MSGALAPYRVIDLSGELGTLCPLLFAGLGADVIRVEPPGGHALRRRGPFLDEAETDSLYWRQMNAGKRSLTLDLEAEDGRERLRRLCEDADFLVESFPPGTMDRLGLGDAVLAERAPRLIYVSITPFGQDGPKAGWQGTDLIGMAAGGLMSLCGDADRAPLRAVVEQAYAHAGLSATVGALVALHARRRSGRGQRVDVSMQAAIANTLGNARLYYAMEGVQTRRAGGGRAFGDSGTRMIYPAADGYVAFIRMPQTFPALAGWMRAEGADVRFDPDAWSRRGVVGTGMPSAEEVAALDGDLEPFFAARPMQDLYERGQRAGVMICPVNTMRDLAGSPQLNARDFFLEVQDGEVMLRCPGPPFRMSATPWARGATPRPGQHTTEILAGLPTASREGASQ